MGVLYKITCKINKKVYIGITSRNLKVRWYGHKKDSKKSNRPLYIDIRKFGIDNFEIEELETFDDDIKGKKLLSSAEIKWIAFYNSTDPNFGYNISPGGGIMRDSTKRMISDKLKGENSLYARLNWEKVSEIRENKENLSREELSKKYNVGSKNIHAIMHNLTWKISDEEFEKYKKELQKSGENHPNAKLNLEQIKEIRENKNNLSQRDLAKKYNVTFQAINIIVNNKKWKLSDEEFKKYKQEPQKSGENHPNCKLTLQKVKEIRENVNNLSQQKLAEMYNVSQIQISRILQNKKWKISEEEFKKYNIKNHSISGENNPNVKLNLKQVKEISQNIDNLSIKELAKKYKISKSAIRSILKNKTWIISK